MRSIYKTLTLTLLTFALFITGCTSAYSSHYGNRAARYNNVPYNNAYRYNTYRHHGAYMGRPYRRYWEEI